MTTRMDDYTAAINGTAGQLYDMINARRIDINDANSDGETLLHQMAHLGKVDHILLLIKEGVEINAKDNRGKTPLIRAMENCRVVASIVLAEEEKDIDAVIFNGKAVLHIAAEAGQFAVAYALIKAGADVNVESKDGKTALQIAKQKYMENPPEFGDFHSEELNMVDLLRFAMGMKL